MTHTHVGRPYFDAWLRRAGRQLAMSGRISQISLVLASELGGSAEHWRQELHTIMQGDQIPSLELLTRIDALLAAPKTKRQPAAEQASLF